MRARSNPETVPGGSLSQAELLALAPQDRAGRRKLCLLGVACIEIDGVWDNPKSRGLWGCALEGGHLQMNNKTFRAFSGAEST